MTNSEWLEKAKDTKIIELIAGYHPKSARDIFNDLPITAPNVQKACNIVCESIEREEEKSDYLKNKNIVVHYLNAISDNNVDKVNKILNETWFGIPESTSCWNITGFKELVDLLDDPADYLFGE